MHRLFLHFLQSHSELVLAAKEKVKQFIDNPEMRSKEVSEVWEEGRGVGREGG